MVLKKRLGEILLESKLITESQLEEALVEAKKLGIKIGRYITRRGILSESQIIDALSRQLRVNKYRPDFYPVDPNLAGLLPLELAKKLQVAPLKKSGRLLTIAMTDPQDINTLDSIEAKTNFEVDPVICTEQEVFRIINDLYQASGLELAAQNKKTSETF
jgi:type IV pilus assembly protein PilB